MCQSDFHSKHPQGESARPPSEFAIHGSEPLLGCLPRSPLAKRENIDDQYKGVSWTELSNTFRHAIQITRGLGAEYIWIDSLCIIQDDHEDRTLEATQMGHVYSNSFLTISATGARDGSVGCFFLKGSLDDCFPARQPREVLVHTMHSSKSLHPCQIWAC